MKNTWYQIEGSKWAEMWTILHLPYTAMNRSFLTIGFGIAGIHRWDVFAWITVAYFLELGIVAHSFDQLPEVGLIFHKFLRGVRSSYQPLRMVPGHYKIFDSSMWEISQFTVEKQWTK